MYPAFKQSVLGQSILTVQGITNPYGVECVTLVWAYAASLFPTVSIKDTITLGNANTLFSNSNPTYFEKIVNNHADVNQLPNQGDVMVFGATPEAGYTNTFNNPDGHTGVFDSATPTQYSLLQQNSPYTGAPANVGTVSWKYRPCIGWLRPIVQNPPAPTVQTVTLPADNTFWHLYHVGGPYVPSSAMAVLDPLNFKVD
jgi:hypothetical protein